MFPVVGRVLVICVAIGQPIDVRPPPCGIAGAPPLCDLNKSEALKGPKRRRYCFAVDPVLHKIIEGAGEPAILRSTVVRELDLEAR
tara:strand:+ start:2449 stop:2706 length:258 start_codon:yes stop_codon:yes gene_type:complete